MPDDATRLVFILGSGRCGSSLLQELISRHAEVAFLSNLEDRWGVPWTARYNSAVYARVPAGATAKGRLRLAPSEGYRAMDREVSPLVSEPGRPLTASDAAPWLARRFAAFFLSRAQRQGLPVFLHKFTGWPRATFVDVVFPQARFINVVRDGRAVANSLVQMPWWRDHQAVATLRRLPTADEQVWRACGESFPLLAGFVWRLVTDAHEQQRQELEPNRWLDVRYEDVLTEPRKELARMLEFVGLDWTSGFERQFLRQRIDGGRREAFRTDLSGADVRLLEDHLGPSLDRYGYR